MTALTTRDLYRLNKACVPIRKAYGPPPYLVGSAWASKGAYRDVDVRLILPDEEFDRHCPTVQTWQVLSLALGAWLVQETGLPIDFQVQRQTEANAKHDGPRNPLGLGGRLLAGGGDATPFDARGERAAAAPTPSTPTTTPTPRDTAPQRSDT